MPRVVSLLGVIFVVAGLALIAYVAFGRSDGPKHDAVAGLPGALRQFTATALPQETATSVPATPSDADVVRLEIPSVEIDASVVTLGVLPDGVMESPHTPTDVGWYSFSARPGTTGNAVFAGHVDYVNYGAAIFYRLRELQSGDEVRVTLADGSSFAYQVVDSELVDAATAPVQEIVGPTENETLTMITCAGAFDQNVLQYDKRLIVRAERSGLAVSRPD